MDYSLSTPVIVIVIVVVAEELFALLILLVPSFSRMLVAPIEKAVSLRPNKSNPMSIIARMTTKNDLFTSTSSLRDYIIG